MVAVITTVMVVVVRVVIVLDETLLHLVREVAFVATLCFFTLLQEHILVNQMEETSDGCTNKRSGEVVREVVSQVAD